MDMLGIVTVEARKVGVNRHLTGPLSRSDYTRTAHGMTQEAEAFAEGQHAVPNPRSVRVVWSVVAWVSAWQIPLQEPVVAAEARRGVDSEWTTYERLLEAERDACTEVRAALAARWAAGEHLWPEDSHWPRLLWRAWLTLDAFPIPPVVYGTSDREGFTRMVQSLPSGTRVFRFHVGS